MDGQVTVRRFDMTSPLESFRLACRLQDFGASLKSKDRVSEPKNQRLAELSDRSEQPEDKWQPIRLFRTCLSSLETATTFGLAMSREARRWQFGEAIRKAFVADGLGWNWSI